MSGGTPRHALPEAGLVGELHAALRGKRCVPYGPDLRSGFADSDNAVDADASVISGPLLPADVDPHAATNPTVVREVLSPSTEAYDRGMKPQRYRGLRTLREHVLVSQVQPLVEVFRRSDDESWTLRTYGPATAVELASLGVRLAVDDLYGGAFADAEADPAVPGA